MDRLKLALMGLGDLGDPEGLARVLLDHMPEGVSLARDTGTIVYTNPAEDRLFGYEPGELLGQHVSVLSAYAPQEGERINRTVREALTRSGSWAGDWLNRRKDGSDFVTRSRVRQIEIGGHRHLLCVHEDVTERKDAEAALRRETRSLAIVNEIGAAVAAERDLERIVQKVTDAGRELTGAEFGAFFYNDLSDSGERLMLYPLSGAKREDFSKFPLPRGTEVFRHTLHGEGVLRSDDILADPRYGRNAPYNGMPEGHLPVRSYLSVPVISRSGEVLGALFYGHGQPGKFGTEHETLLLGIAGHAATAIDNARLFQANERELAERRRAEAALQDLNATLESQVAEAVAERAQAEAALRQSQKMEAMGQLTGGVAHDFNNLLTPIMVSLDGLLHAGVGDRRERRLLEGALQAAERAKLLVQRLLAFARRQPLQPKPVDVAELAHGIADLVASTMGPQIKVLLDVEHGVSAAVADANQLEMAIINLSVNARDAMPEGGSLRLAVRNETVTAARAAGVPPGRYVRLTVSDTGVGMDEATLARAVEPFFSTKGVGKGTGLGLSMVHGLVAQLGGSLTIESQPGAGTSVALWLPATDGDVDRAPARATGATGATASPQHGTVLLVDDEDLVRVAASDMLAGLGYQVVEANSAQEALELVAKGLAPDLLVTDHLMPGMSGTELARILKAQHPAMPALLVSGYADAEGISADLPRLNKPFRRAELAASLDRLRA